MPVTTCPRCHGAGLLARGNWLRTCRRCRGTGRARPWTAERLYRHLERYGLVPSTRRDRPGLQLWTAGKITPSARVARLVERHYAGLLAFVAAAGEPPSGVRAAHCPLVNEGPPWRAEP